MMKPLRWLTAAFLCMGVTIPAAAWGPRAQSSIVLAAAHMLSKENAIPLTNLLEHIRAGADVSPVVLTDLMPDAETDPLSAIVAEMNLLQTIRGPRVDPYFAYRLGVLGKLVARITAPMLTADPRYRTLYQADVENRITNVALQSAPRRDVDPPIYFSVVQREAAARQDVIEKEYQTGVGFRGLASQSLPQDISRSVNAVADVWYTILQGRAQVVNVSPDRIRDYHVSALEYYISRRNTRETNAVYDRLTELGVQTPDLRKRIGDMFYDAEQYDRAMQEYRAVLVEQPGRRDVVQRISEYFRQQGDEATKSGRLEAARQAYKQAAEADRLDPGSQEKLIETERRIADRDERQKAAQTALDEAFAMEKAAEDLLRRGDYTGAMEQLAKAEQLYGDVTDEFIEERRAAESGLNNVLKRKAQLKDELLRNAQNFSGSGLSADIQLLIKGKAATLAEEALRELLQKERNSELKRLATEKRERDRLITP